MKIFFSAPYTNYIDSRTGLIQENFKFFLQEIMNYFLDKGIEIVNSHLREEWGANLFTPDKAIVSDFNSITDVDCVVAFIGEPPSSGVLMELGFAASKKKQILIIVKKGSSVPYLVQGLNNWTKTDFICFNDFNDLFSQFDELINCDI